MDATEQQPALFDVMTRSAFSAPNVILLIAAFVTAAALQCSWIVVAAMCVYGARVARQSGSASFRRKLLAAEARRRRVIPSEGSLLDPALQSIARSLRRGYANLRRALAHAPAPIRMHARSVAATLEELREPAAQLLCDANRLGFHLGTLSQPAVESDIQALAAAITCSDEKSGKLEYQRALSVRRDQLAALTHVTRERERILASLWLLVSTIDAFPAWLLRLRVLESRARNDLVGDTTAQLTRLRLELGVTASAAPALEARAPEAP